MATAMFHNLHDVSPQTITLKATGMLSPKLPIVLFGKEYWHKVRQPHCRTVEVL